MRRVLAQPSSTSRLPARDVLELNLVGVQNQGTYLSAMVEINGGGGFVEQRADTPYGSAVSPCSNSTSSEWDFADNYTLNDSRRRPDRHQPVPRRCDRQLPIRQQRWHT